MNVGVQRIAWLPGLLLLIVVPGPAAHAQFEEPDTVPRFSIGAAVELVFRGKRGEGENPAGGTVSVSFGGGPALGLRAEYRITRTLSAGIAGSWASLNEQLKTATATSVSAEGFTQLQFTGELQFKVKPNIPGFFILGGGARYIDPRSSDPNDYVHTTQSFTEPLGILGAGLETGGRTSRVFKLDLRVYFVAPSEQQSFETKSLAIDWALDLAFLFRL
jgi:hypothetical protein